MEALSERYGWTPRQIREQNAPDIDAYVHIIQKKEHLKRKALLKYHGTK